MLLPRISWHSQAILLAPEKVELVFMVIVCEQWMRNSDFHRFSHSTAAKMNFTQNYVLRVQGS